MCEYNLRPEFSTNEMGTTEANLEIKVTQLDMAVDKTNAVLHGGKNEAIERHISSLKYISSEINHMRLNFSSERGDDGHRRMERAARRETGKG